ncbi:MAG TPA: DUF4013 domain-containing protein [Thermoanaerobaculia bacterium]|nr:DUF4013 domain-containing protein [Thermoanaerobaculia bacterium]
MSDMTFVPPPPPPPPPHATPAPAVPPRNPNEFDFGKPFTFVFEDPLWVNKILIGGLFQLAAVLLIGWPFVLGYCAKLARNVAAGMERPLPDWDDLGEYFAEGLRLIAVGIVYVIPFIALFAIFIIPSMALTSTDNEAAQGLGAGLASCVWCLMVPISLAVMIFLPASMLFVSIERRFGAAFEFGRIWPFIKNNIGNYLLAIVVYLIADFVGGFGILLLCIGVVFTAFWALMVKVHAFAQVYRIATLTPAPAATPTVSTIPAP